MTDEKKRSKGPNLHFVESWFMGMNDYEIAKQIGVDIHTLRSVKKDLYDKEKQANQPKDQW